MPIKNFVLISIGAVVLFCGMLTLKIPFISHAMDGPEFCGFCHSMDAEVDSYLHSAHRNAASCSDCHIPHGVVAGSYYKAYSGTKDMAFTLVGEKENISISEFGKDIVQKNCMECHQEFLAQIGNTMVNGRYCFDCHTNVRHLN